MKIGIIGAGQIGGTLTRRLTALGHKVFVANSRGPETLSDLAAETGATAVSVPEAVRGVDLIVVTIPQKNIPNLPAGLFADTPDRVVVVDTGNYYPRLSFPKIRSGLDSRREAESSHHPGRCLQSCTRSECSSPTCSSRDVGLRPKTCFSVINSASP